MIRKTLVTLSTMLLLVLAFQLGSTSVQAQATKAKLSTNIESQQVVPNQPVEILFYLNTQGLSTDGVEVTGTWSGVQVRDAKLSTAGDARFQTVTQSIENNTFAITLAAADPSVPIIAGEDALVFALTLTPSEAGELKIEFDQDGTLVAASDGSGNVLTAPESVKVPVAADQASTGSEAEVNGSSRIHSIIKTQAPAMLALAIAGGLIVVGLVVLRRQSRRLPVPPAGE